MSNLNPLIVITESYKKRQKKYLRLSGRDKRAVAYAIRDEQGRAKRAQYKKEDTDWERRNADQHADNIQDRMHDRRTAAIGLGSTAGGIIGSLLPGASKKKRINKTGTRAATGVAGAGIGGWIGDKIAGLANRKDAKKRDELRKKSDDLKKKSDKIDRSKRRHESMANTLTHDINGWGFDNPKNVHTKHFTSI